MKCPKCGYVSFDHHESCGKCQAKLTPAKETLGLAGTVAAAAALEAEHLGPPPPPTPAQERTPERTAPPAPAAEGPAIQVKDPGFELDLSGLEGPAVDAALSSLRGLEPAEVEAATAQPTIEVAPELEAAVARLIEDSDPEPTAARSEGPWEPAEPVNQAQPTEPAQPARPTPEFELPKELADLVEGELEVEAQPAEDAPAEPDLPEGDLDDEIRKFLEQEGISAEELNAEPLQTVEEAAADDEGSDDDQDLPPMPPSGGTGGPGEGEARFRMDGEDGGGSHACQAEEPRRAGFFQRALALGIDASLLGLLTAALFISSAAAYFWAVHQLGPSADPLRLFSLCLLTVPLALPLALTTLSLAYFTCFHGLAGRTPGKMLVGLRVCAASGEGLGCGRAFLRTVGYLTSAIPFALGFLWAAGSERQAWHDLMARSVVLVS